MAESSVGVMMHNMSALNQFFASLSINGLLILIIVSIQPHSSHKPVVSPWSLRLLLNEVIYIHFFKVFHCSSRRNLVCLVLSRVYAGCISKFLIIVLIYSN